MYNRLQITRVYPAPSHREGACYGTSITSVSTGCMRSQVEFTPFMIILNTFACPWIFFNTVIACRLIPTIGSVSSLHERRVQRPFGSSITSSRRWSCLKHETCSRDAITSKGYRPRSACEHGRICRTLGSTCTRLSSRSSGNNRAKSGSSNKDQTTYPYPGAIHTPAITGGWKAHNATRVIDCFTLAMDSMYRTGRGIYLWTTTCFTFSQHLMMRWASGSTTSVRTCGSRTDLKRSLTTPRV